MIIILTEKLYITIMGRFASLFNFLLNLTILVGYIYKSHKITLMKLNTKSRYAVMALADLAKFSSQNPVSLRDISLRQNISILYLEQIFLKLKKNNMRRYFAIHLTKKILKILLRILPIQTTPWDSFSIKKYDFNHVPITNPETFKLKSYAKSLNDILRLSKLPSCNNN